MPATHRGKSRGRPMPRAMVAASPRSASAATHEARLSACLESFPSTSTREPPENGVACLLARSESSSATSLEKTMNSWSSTTAACVRRTSRRSHPPMNAQPRTSPTSRGIARLACARGRAACIHAESFTTAGVQHICDSPSEVIPCDSPSVGDEGNQGSGMTCAIKPIGRPSLSSTNATHSSVPSLCV